MLSKVIKFRTLILNYLNNWGQGIKFTRRARREAFAGGHRTKKKSRNLNLNYNKKDEKKSQAQKGMKKPKFL